MQGGRRTFVRGYLFQSPNYKRFVVPTEFALNDHAKCEVVISTPAPKFLHRRSLSIIYAKQPGLYASLPTYTLLALP